jgi:choice-of-anchor A domain-containing protein
MSMTHPLPTRRAPLTAEPLEARDVPSAYDLGDAAVFNALFFINMTAMNSDVEGRVAVGAHGSFTSYGIGDRLLPDPKRDDLIVGGNLDYTNGQVFNGSAVYGGGANLKGVGTPNGSVRQEADVLPFGAIEQDLAAKSASWGAEAPNGLTTVRYSNLNLRGTHPQLDIFTVTPAQLAVARTICLIVPFGATALINVPGDEASIRDLGLKLRGADASHILWNFYETDRLTISGVGLKGSVLAPAAHLDFNNGTTTGTVAARSMAGNGQFNLAPVRIHIEIQRTASLAGQVFIDDNGNSVVDPMESGQEGADVELTGRDTLGRSIRVDHLSGTNGQFNFGPLVPGNYTVRVVPPQRYAESTQEGVPGTVEGTTVGLGDVNRVTAILLGEGDDGIDYLLPLQPNPN